MRQVYEDENRTKFDALNIGGYEIPELRYADDSTLLSSTASGLEKTIMSVKSHFLALYSATGIFGTSTASLATT